MGFLRDDVRYALRGLRRNPGYTLLATLTIGLGLGANTAIFAVLQSVVLRPLPYDEPERVVAVRTVSVASGTEFSASFPQFEDYQARNRVFSAVAAWREAWPTMVHSDGRPPTRVSAVGVTHRMFPLLGIDIAVGRGFTGADEEPGNERTVILSHTFWNSQFGRSPEVIGLTLRLDEDLYTVVGILPASFQGEAGGGSLPPAGADLWLPYLNSSLVEGRAARGLTNVNVVARLAEDVTLQEAQNDVVRVMADLSGEYESHVGESGRVVLAQEALLGSVRGRMFMLFGAVTLVLLLACTNVTNLVLGRTSVRARELALRSALGAGRAPVVRLLFIEVLLIALFGATIGLVFVQVGLRVFAALDPGGIPRLAASSVGPTTITFLFAASLVVAVLVGLIPALLATGSGIAHALKEDGRGAVSGRSRLQKVLVVAQVSIAAVLLLGGGLVIRSLERALAVDPGFEAEGLLSARVAMPTPFVSQEWPRHVAFFRDAVAALEALPGVQSAAAGYADPADPAFRNGFSFEGRPPPEPGRGPSSIFRPVTPGYFSTVGIPLVRGRTFSDADDSSAPGVVVVNEAFVRRFFGEEDPLGKRLVYGDFWRARPPEYEIIGIVQDVRFGGLTSEPREATYFPHAQQPVREMSFVLRSATDANGLVPGVRAALAAIDPTIPVYRIATLEEKINAGLAGRRFLAVVLGAFAALAGTLAGLGLYGVLSFLVARRTREIGIRMAVGARPQTVLAQVVREGMALIVMGLMIGVPAALTLSRFLESILFEVEPNDPTTAVLVSLGLLMVGLIACLVPGRTATGTDPLSALRAE